MSPQEQGALHHQAAIPLGAEEGDDERRGLRIEISTRKERIEAMPSDCIQPETIVALSVVIEGNSGSLQVRSMVSRFSWITTGFLL